MEQYNSPSYCTFQLLQWNQQPGLRQFQIFCQQDHVWPACKSIQKHSKHPATWSIDAIFLCSPTIQIYTYLKVFQSTLFNEDGSNKDDSDVELLWEGMEWKKEDIY